MSLRRKSNHGYNRAKESEENHWSDLLWAEEYYLIYDDEWDFIEERDWAWYYMGAPHGYCTDVAEYQQMRLLTLLRKLAINTANDQARSRGW